MDSNTSASTSPQPESEASSELKSESEKTSKKRKMVEKTVLAVKIRENVGKLKNEGLPSDFWSWRKYGQKPIKGSPYPRGYYKCSTSKGCSAKKQVERCRTDASMLIITYTSTHNHPCPTTIITNLPQQPKESESETTQGLSTTSKEEDQEHIEEEQTNNKPSNEKKYHYLQSPIRCSQDIIIEQEDPFKLNTEKNHDRTDLLSEEQPLCYAQLNNLSASKNEELDFYDELEELPMSSSFLHFTRNIFSDESIPVAPS